MNFLTFIIAMTIGSFVIAITRGDGKKCLKKVILGVAIGVVTYVLNYIIN